MVSLITVNCCRISETEKEEIAQTDQQQPAQSNKTFNQSRVNANCRRKLTTPHHYAYIKIAEGCDRHCAYCAIPLITGKHVSRPIDDILNEVQELVKEGVKEFQIIEQELTYYGIDLYHKPMIAELISRMADIPGVKWIRLHYAYPNQFPLEPAGCDAGEAKRLPLPRHCPSAYF